MSVFSSIKEKIMGSNHKGTGSTVVITPLGSVKSEKEDLPKPWFDILNYVKENGPSTERELARELGKDQGKVHVVVTELRGEGYVKYSAATEQTLSGD